jgi:hypothetical protein
VEILFPAFTNKLELMLLKFFKMLNVCLEILVVVLVII